LPPGGVLDSRSRCRQSWGHRAWSKAKIGKITVHSCSASLASPQSPLGDQQTSGRPPNGPLVLIPANSRQYRQSSHNLRASSSTCSASKNFNKRHERDAGGRVTERLSFAGRCLVEHPSEAGGPSKLLVFLTQVLGLSRLSTAENCAEERRLVNRLSRF